LNSEKAGEAAATPAAAAEAPSGEDVIFALRECDGGDDAPIWFGGHGAP